VFNQYGIKATFATVGFLFSKNKEELLLACPNLKPTYLSQRYNVYQQEISTIGSNENDDALHFGWSLVHTIKNTNHEIGSHTFSHYYCLEKGQTSPQFDADINAAVQIAKVNNIKLNSFVFPRNQVNKNYLQILANNGFIAYRGNPNSWIYKPRRFLKEFFLIRLLRLLDTYLPISGNKTCSIEEFTSMPVNIPASRFLKPYVPYLKWFEKLRIRRIKNEMTKAAERKDIYHLWWHPHNFGANMDKNFAVLNEILLHYKYLEKKMGFTNVTMEKAAQLIITSKNDQ
jgi:peptidoglycan/xylan/chitin deacetylase (PgdA/CDA1 family)